MTTIIRKYLSFALILCAGCMSDNLKNTDQTGVIHLGKTTKAEKHEKVVTIKDPIRKSDLAAMLDSEENQLVSAKEEMAHQNINIAQPPGDDVAMDHVFQKSTDAMSPKNQTGLSDDVQETGREEVEANVPNESTDSSEEPSFPPDDLSPEIYRLKRGDSITISVFDDDDMTKTVSVLPDGNVNYALIGNVLAINKTFSELASEIEERLSKFYHNPSVNINPNVDKPQPNRNDLTLKQRDASHQAAESS